MEVLSELPPESVRLRLFLSVDIVGSSAFKARPRMYQAGAPWLELIGNFFQTFSSEFETNVLRWERTAPGEVRPELPIPWKALGDEIIFTSVIGSHRDLVYLLKRFIQTVSAYEQENLMNTPLRLKTAAWCANFPYPNIEITARSLNQRIRDEHQMEFIGPSIDTGFRLGKMAKRGATVLSLELAELVAKGISESPDIYGDMRLRQIGWAQLPGVIGEKPYPLFWLWCPELRLDHWEVDFRRSLEETAPQNIPQFCAQIRRELVHLDVIEAIFGYDEIPANIMDHFRNNWRSSRQFFQ